MRERFAIVTAHDKAAMRHARRPASLAARRPALLSYSIASGYFFVLSHIHGGALWWLAAVGLPIGGARVRVFVFSDAS